MRFEARHDVDLVAIVAQVAAEDVAERAFGIGQQFVDGKGGRETFGKPAVELGPAGAFLGEQLLDPGHVEQGAKDAVELMGIERGRRILAALAQERRGQPIAQGRTVEIARIADEDAALRFDRLGPAGEIGEIVGHFAYPLGVLWHLQTCSGCAGNRKRIARGGAEPRSRGDDVRDRGLICHTHRSKNGASGRIDAASPRFQVLRVSASPHESPSTSCGDCKLCNFLSFKIFEQRC
ncbi:MAG: hypothetical protein NTX28_13085, partial [Novosphingobium sp.]|nr:hypothetical protein [Novosphingobium sp.]